VKLQVSDLKLMKHVCVTVIVMFGVAQVGNDSSVINLEKKPKTSEITQSVLIESLNPSSMI